MNRLSMALSTMLSSLAFIATATAEVPPWYQPIPITDCWLQRTDCAGCGGITRGDTYPTGVGTYAGVPFDHGTDFCYGFTGYYHPGTEWTLPVGLPKARAVHLLLSTWNWAECIDGPDIQVSIADSAGQSLAFALRNGDDIRNHNIAHECDVVNGVRTVEVWTNGYGQALDKIRLELGDLADLHQLTIFDPPGIERWPILFGVTVELDEDCNGDGIVDYGQILDGTFEDVNSNGIPDCCDAGESCDPCPGDITGGGQVNGVDLAAILGAWGTDGQGKLDCDINDDGTVDAQDLAIVLGGWGNCP